MINIINSIFDWLWGMSPLLVLGILFLVGVISVWGRRIVFLVFKGTITRKYALEAVRGAEKLVTLLGKEKFILAVKFLNSEIKRRFKFSLPSVLLEKIIIWAYDKMVANGEEIKAADVLKVPKEQLRFDVKKLDIKPVKTGFEINYHTKF